MQAQHNKSSEPTRESIAALRGEFLDRAARLKRYAAKNSLVTRNVIRYTLPYDKEFQAQGP